LSELRSLIAMEPVKTCPTEVISSTKDRLLLQNYFKLINFVEGKQISFDYKYEKIHNLKKNLYTGRK
jgi:hypothetical protein